MNISRTKKLTTTGMLCALSYVAMVVGRVPLILFLKYDPKDVIIVIGGLIFGPLTSFTIAVIVSVAQMLTVSGTGMIGCIMNIISSCSFACTAAFIYQKRHKLSGAVLALFCGCGCQVAVMMLWNYLIAPIYMGYPREAIVELLLPAFLPFNLIKGGLNAAITMLLYKPVVTVLRRSNLIEPSYNPEKARLNIGLSLGALLVIITCVLLILSFNGII
ncbi:MAG: ECF transporter S component [Lachnospiraceae bacterium]|nr:ECF transporter S component [Lachnospiraceae bacterium]